jgi:hypothetical protein
VVDESPPDPTRAPRQERGAPGTTTIVVAITVVGLAVRVATALVADRDALGFDDQGIYHWLATSLDRGHGFALFGEPTVRWPPLFPFLLSVLYRVTGADPTWGFLLNATISAAAIPLVALVGVRRLGRTAGLVAAGIVAVLPGQWLFSATLLTEPLAGLQLLGVVAIVACCPLRARTAVGLGLLIGAAALTRGEGVLLGLVALAGYWGTIGWKRLAGHLALAAAVAAAVALPWALRNADVAGEWVGLSNNGADTLWAGHNPSADGGPTYPPPELLAPTRELPPGVERELAVASILREDALEWMRENPGRVVSLVPAKLVSLLSGDGKVVTIWIEAREPALGAAGRPLAVTADVAWYALLAALALTVVRARGRLLAEPWSRAALTLPVLALPLYGIVLYGNFRYRIPYQPVLALLVAPTVVELASWRPGRVGGGPAADQPEVAGR